VKVKGFIDLHTHGLGRHDTRTSSPEAILKLAEMHRKAGVSKILPTVYAGHIAEMRQNMNAVKEAMKLSDAILGVHLEGPFLNPGRCGALDKDVFIKPTVSNLKRLIEGFEDIVRIITIAPELPGALKVIEKCVESGIRVNMGHSDATLKEALNGKNAGATGITHLFNAMRPFHHREPGLAGAGLLDDDLYVEVIADGVHLHPETIKLVFKMKRKDRIILVSDSIKGAMYKKGVLQGSKITIPEALAFLRKLGIPEGWLIKAGRDNPKKYLLNPGVQTRT
jgi:N-acetylglucosamine-6-phosphate deacetylase